MPEQQTQQANPDRLNLEPNIDDPDGFYQQLLAIHEGLDKPESDAINARLILILCNHIGNDKVLKEALTKARNPARS